jgi:excisionase family DNA binding protein
MNGETYLSVEDVAKRFGVNATTVYRLAQRGDLPAIKVGSQWRFSRQALESWEVNQLAQERFRKNNGKRNLNQ